ncbi:MAG: hypothetical protein Q8S18_01845 [Bacteroidales bacterium]|nr:hypothetical protein [Bacteroidales bacterium]
MKPIKTMLILMLFSILMVAASSCVTVRQGPAKNQPRGWFKNSNNPHHPRTTNPGHKKWKKSKKHKSD